MNNKEHKRLSIKWNELKENVLNENIYEYCKYDSFPRWCTDIIRTVRSQLIYYMNLEIVVGHCNRLIIG